MLIGAGVLEAVWATALAASHGGRRLKPTILFVASLAASMVGLAFAMRHQPTGTTYAVWVGIGATLVALWGMVTGGYAADRLVA